MARPQRKPGHEGERRATHTVNGYCRVLRAFAGWLAEAGYVDAHPLGTFRPGRLPTREVEPIAADDQQRLLDACDPRSPLGLRDLAILSVLLDTGLRSSELCRLLVADLDLASGEVRMRGGKGARDRTVALGQRARSMVYRYLQLARPWPDDPDPDADRVFLTRQRRPFTRYTLGRVLKRLAARAKLANIHPHRFRHTFGVTYLRAGGDVLTLQRILGHTTLVMVNHYLHLSSSDVVDRHRAHSPLDRLPNGRTFRRAAPSRQPAWLRTRAAGALDACRRCLAPRAIPTRTPVPRALCHRPIHRGHRLRDGDESLASAQLAEGLAGLLKHVRNSSRAVQPQRLQRVSSFRARYPDGRPGGHSLT